MGAAIKNSKLIRAIEDVNEVDDYREFRLATRNGRVLIRFYPVEGATSAALMVGGVGGDFDSPARGLYPRLAHALKQTGIASLRVQFRDPIDLDDSTADVLAGIEFLTSRGIMRVGLIGHSFGGAVAIQVALRSRDVVTVVTLATQGFGTEGVEDLAPRSILFIHGYDDQVLPPVCSIDAYDRAGEPKDLMLLENTHHTLDESADHIYVTVLNWISQALQEVNDPRPGELPSPS